MIFTDAHELVLSSFPLPPPTPPYPEVDCNEVKYNYLTMVTHSPHRCGVLPGLRDNLLSLQVFEEVRGLLVDGQDVVFLRQPSLGSMTPGGDLRMQTEYYGLAGVIIGSFPDSPSFGKQESLWKPSQT